MNMLNVSNCFLVLNIPLKQNEYAKRFQLLYLMGLLPSRTCHHNLDYISHLITVNDFHELGFHYSHLLSQPIFVNLDYISHLIRVN